MKKKLKLTELDISSFVTSISDEASPTIAGANVSTSVKVSKYIWKLIKGFGDDAVDAVDDLPKKIRTNKIDCFTLGLQGDKLICAAQKSKRESCPQAFICDLSNGRCGGTAA